MRVAAKADVLRCAGSWQGQPIGHALVTRLGRGPGVKLKRPDGCFRYRQQVQIVLAQAGDADIVLAMASALSLDGPLDRAAFNVQFNNVVRSERSVALLAIDQSTVVGYAVGAVVPMPMYMGGAAFLQELYVDASNRRGGVGTALVEAFTDWAAQLGAARVVLATSRAGPFYESIGFSTRGQYYARTITLRPTGFTPARSPPTGGRASPRQMRAFAEAVKTPSRQPLAGPIVCGSTYVNVVARRGTRTVEADGNQHPSMRTLVSASVRRLPPWLAFHHVPGGCARGFLTRDRKAPRTVCCRETAADG